MGRIGGARAVGAEGDFAGGDEGETDGIRGRVAPLGDDLVAVSPARKELGNQVGRMLQIAVHAHDGSSPSLRHARQPGRTRHRVYGHGIRIRLRHGFASGRALLLRAVIYFTGGGGGAICFKFSPPGYW